MSEEWGPWVDDSPADGEYIQVVAEIDGGGRTVFEGIVVDSEEDDDYYRFDLSPKPFVGLWLYVNHRVRKPKGLTILNAILREVEREKETV